jgi:hypothetical protein
MTPTISREELREQINTLECVHDLISAIDDVTSSDLRPSEAVKLAIADSEGQAIAIIRGIPYEIVVLGLKAMRDAMNQSARRAANEVKEAV